MRKTMMVALKRVAGATCLMKQRAADVRSLCAFLLGTRDPCRSRLNTRTPGIDARLESYGVASSITGEVGLRLARRSTCKLFECDFLATAA
jgi:hypothetical protein